MSLAQITKEIRLSSKIIGALLVVGIIIFLFFQGGVFIQKVFFPTPPPPPEQKFGELTEIAFPETSSPTPEYRINTISGQLPTFSDRIRVYPIIQNDASITALKTARDNAFNAGFSENQKAETTSTYSWTHFSTQSILKMNIISHDFTISSNLSGDPIFSTGQTLTPANAIENTLSIIDTLGANSDDISPENISTIDYSIVNGAFLPGDSFQPKQSTKVILKQNPVDKLPIYYPVFQDSTLYFYLSFINGKVEVIDASYIHKVPNLNESSTYPLKSTNQAYEELKSGKGFIVNPTTDEIVDITDISLGYYIDNSSEQKYLMPIFVFKGKNDFEAYIQAIPQ